MTPFRRQEINRERGANGLLKDKLPDMGRDERGLTLVEVMVVVVVIAILAYFVAPELTGWGAKSRLKGQSDQLFSALQEAKICALKNNTDVVFDFNVSSCPSGYSCYDFRSTLKDCLVNATLDDGITLTTNFTSGSDGFDFRGLPKNVAAGAKSLNVTKTDVSGVKYEIGLSIAGGLTIEKH